MVYNADSGLAHAILDSLHKLVSPATYDCRLCAIGHGTFGMKREWAAAVAALPYPVRFLHRDEWRRLHPGCRVQLPAILIDRPGGIEMLLDGPAFRSIDGIPALVAALHARLGAKG